MKKVLFIVLFAPLLGWAQVFELPVDSATKVVRYESVIEVNSTSQNEIYFRAKNWISDNFRNAKAVIETDEKESGLIVVKGNSSFYWNFVSKSKNGKDIDYGIQRGNLKFSIKLFFKEGKTKIVITDLSTNNFADDYNRPYENVDWLLVLIYKNSKIGSTEYDIYSKISNEINNICQGILKSYSTEIVKSKKNERDF